MSSSLDATVIIKISLALCRVVVGVRCVCAACCRVRPRRALIMFILHVARRPTVHRAKRRQTTATSSSSTPNENRTRLEVAARSVTISFAHCPTATALERWGNNLANHACSRSTQQLPNEGRGRRRRYKRWPARYSERCAN